MAKKYLHQLTALISKSTSGRFKDIKLECKHFFSGAAVYANGKICISLTPVGFAIKLPEKSQIILMKEKGAKYLRYFPKGHIKKDYVILPKALLKDTKMLYHWVNASIKYVITNK